MINSELVRNHEDRGFWRTFFYPAYLTQDFTSRNDLDLQTYFGECDYFHVQIMNDRIAWLRDSKFKHQIYYTTNYINNVPVYPIVYRLHVEMASKEEAKLYMARWE